MRIGYVQNNPLFGQVQRNFEQIRHLLGNEKLDLLVLPELFSSGYLFKDTEELMIFAEKAGEGPVSEFLVDLAGKMGGFVVGGFAELSDGHIYNAAALVGPKGMKRVYRKIHLFDREKLFFDQSQDPFWVQDIGGCRLGIMICFDWYFPESARTLALRGADVIAHPSNLVLSFCPEAMKTRALENRVFTVTANRIGTDQRDFHSLAFIGRSAIYSPKGTLLASSQDNCVELRTTVISIDNARYKKVTGRNDLFNDRRPDFYER